jgi:hypothetical protein
MAGAWITSIDPTGEVTYYRSTVSLPAAAANAWLAIAARDTFELSVNGQVVGTQSLWRPNRAFQFTMSERGQRVNNAKTIPWVSYARDYQWTTYQNYRLPVFFDLGRVLQPGANAICIKVDARTAPTGLCVDGEVLLASGQRLPLRSDSRWKTAPTPRRAVALDWTDARYDDHAWEHAHALPPAGETFRTFATEIFSAPFAGRWLRADGDNLHQPVWFETTWELERRPSEGWIRLMTNRAYDLYINGRKVTPPSLGSNDLTTSDWVINSLLGAGRPRRPEAIDPEDADTLFGSIESGTGEDEGKSQTSEAVGPTALSRNAQVGTFDAYSVGAMLKAGTNKIALRLVDRDMAFQWAPQFALDGRARMEASEARVTTSPAHWSAHFHQAGSKSERLPVVEAGNVRGDAPPVKKYLGYCYSSDEKLSAWARCGGVALCLVMGLASYLWMRCGSSSEARECLLARGVAVMAIAGTVLAGAIVLDSCFAVRDEILWMLPGTTWAAILLLSAAAGGGTLIAILWDEQWIGMGWRKQGFQVAMAGLLVVCGVTRIYRVEFQPTDADEWASLQTILAIVDTGTPKLTHDVYYTRSPLYHYVVAASVKVFGRNFLALRGPGALFAVATCSLIYLCGKRLLKSRWIGLAAAALFTIHPLAICMGHQIRFYQQQQFFALLTVYYFCLGFVSEQRMKYRYLALAAFFAAVFSQEIAVMIGMALVASYLLFAEGKDWRTESKWLIVAGCGLVFVVLDFVIFQTVCLTRVDGVSPRVEPALKPNLMFPSTLYWIFSLFSRLHFGLSAVFLGGLPFALRSRNRNVLALYLTFAGGLVFSTVLITGAGVRFQYWLFPIFILLAVHGARELAAFALAPTAGERWHGQVRWTMAALLVMTIGLSWSPWKIPGSYATKILPDVDGALAYVRENRGSEDAVAITAPHTAAALCEVGRVDYDIEIPLLHDFVYRKNGRLIDRNAGAEVISKLDQLQDACARHERIWVVLNRDIRFRSPGERIAWQDPGGRFDLFVRTNLELKYQTYLTDVFLWDGSKGRLRGFRRSL